MSLCCIHQHPNADHRLWCMKCESLVAGVQIGDYTIQSYLGRGSFSVVYLVQQRSLHNRRVVMKVLLPVSGQEPLASFHQEAQLLASLMHPYILPLYSYGVIDEPRTDALHAPASPYLVLPYAEQGSLHAAFKREGEQPWPLERVVPIIEEAAEALTYAHARGVLHRDVKPANLLLFGSHVVLADFGVSCLIEPDMSHLQAPWAGSPAYMAPEVWTMQPGRYSDQYSLAVTCFYLLTGKLPWGGEGKPTNWSHQHRYVAPRSLREYRPDLPQTVSVVLQHALAKGPHDRYPDMKAFAADLRLAMQDTARVSLTVPTPATRAPLSSTPTPVRIRISAIPTQQQHVARAKPASVLSVPPVLLAERSRADPLTEGPTAVTESLMRKELAGSEWHFERVNTTEILRRTASNHWTRPGLLLNAVLCLLLCAFVAWQSGLPAAELLAISVLPAFAVVPLLARFFRQSFTLGYSWGILTGLLFGTIDALLSTLACFSWSALVLTLSHGLPDWQQFGSSYLQQAASTVLSAVLLGVLILWPAVLGGMLIGIAAVQSERRRMTDLNS